MKVGGYVFSVLDLILSPENERKTDFCVKPVLRYLRIFAFRNKKLNKMRKILSFAIMLLGVLSVSACTPAKKETESMKGKKVLVAYFSWSGNTRAVAKYITGKLGADEFQIVREKPYSKEYEPCTEEAKVEKEKNERPAIKGRVARMEDYDVVFVGVPVWWYTAPMPVFTFLEQYDFKGKTVIPFCTCYTAEYETLKDIVKATSAADHRKGLTIVTKEMGGKGMDNKHAQIDKWLGEIGF